MIVQNRKELLPVSMALNATSGKPLTAVFVDYECWFWELHKYRLTPNIREFVDDIKTRGSLQQITFFGDFSKPELAREIHKLRTVTTDIIDSKTPDSAKDYTDFMMLHHIYRTVLIDDKIGQYVLVTGDGHFSDVTAFLTTFKDITVGIYAVEGTLSRQLRDAASWCYEIPIKCGFADDECIKAIFGYVKRLEQRSGYIPTFSGTVKDCSKYNGFDSERIKASLEGLIKNGYISRDAQIRPDNGQGITAIVVDWNKAHQEGLWAENN